MAEKETKEKTEMEKKLDKVCAEVRFIKDAMERHSKNFVKHMIQGHSDAPGPDGKIGTVGSVRIGWLIGLALGMCAMLAIADDEVIDQKDTTTGGMWKLYENTGATEIHIIGSEGKDARLLLDADDGDDPADTWTIESEATGNDLSIMNGVTEVLNLTSAGNLQIDGTFTPSGGSVLGDVQTTGSLNVDLTDAADEIDIDQTNGSGTASTPLMSINDDRTGPTANEASEATIWIDAEGSYGLAVVDGIVQVEAEIDTPSGDLLLDPAGSEVHIDGGLHVGGVAAVGDNNLRVDGTANIISNVRVGGTLTSTGNVIAVANVDAASFTVDAGAGLDSQAAGTLMIGASIADKVEVADTSVQTEIQGNLDVLQTANFAAAVTAASEVVSGTLHVNGATTVTNLTLDDGSTLDADNSVIGCDNGVVNAEGTTFNLNGSTFAGTTISVSGGLDVNAAMAVTNVTLDNGATLDADDAIVGINNGNLNATNCTIDLNASTIAGTISGGVAMSGDLVVGDDATIGGLLRITPTPLTVTNGQVLTIADGVYNITSQGQASGTTNDITFANPTTAGDIAILNVLAVSSNGVGLTDSGNMSLEASWGLDDDDCIMLYAPSTSLWIQMAVSRN